MTTPSTTTKEHQMTTIQLTPAQHAILAYAIEHTGGKIEWFPDNIKGGARTKVLEGLFNKALITRDSTDWFVAAEGYEPWGAPGPTPATITPTRGRGRRVGRRGQLGARKTGRGQATAQGRRRGQAPHPREQQAGRRDPDAATPGGGHHQPDLRGHRLAGAHGARHLCRAFKRNSDSPSSRKSPRAAIAFTGSVEFEMGWRHIHATPMRFLK
jgi:hypothetical protein